MSFHRSKRLFVSILPLYLLLTISFVSAQESAKPAKLRAGAYAIDITPKQLPVIVNGDFFPRTIGIITDPLHSRAIVLESGKTQIALVVVDTCIIPKTLADEAKELIEQKTGIPKHHVMISSTHCHSAPSLVKTLGTPREESYAPLLPGWIAEGVAQAQKNLQPAKIGWAVGNDRNNVYNRRFLMKEGTASTNPFGGKTNDRAMMNPGHANPNKIARTGPVDTAVSVISILSSEDKPIALYANYSTHYAGAPNISADYFAVFAQRIRDKIAEKIGKESVPEGFMAMISNGTSGDANCIDFLDPERRFDYKTVGEEVAQAAMDVWSNIEYRDSIVLRMEETLLQLENRLPSEEEIRKAKEHVASLPEGKPKTVPDVYAINTLAMQEHEKTVSVIVQAARIGELGITALPAEVYGITGLEIKARSPLHPTINVSLANGSFGYIPPPEQHALGGYNTWRTSGNSLEEQAEPKIKAAAIELLHKIAR